MQVLPFVILSGCIEGMGIFQNKSRTNQLKRDLEVLGLSFKEVQGVYCGSSEDSFLVTIGDDTDLVRIMVLAQLYEQECVLFSDEQRQCKLLYTDGSSKQLGALKPIPKDQLVRFESYTYDPITDQYFATVG